MIGQPAKPMSVDAGLEVKELRPGVLCFVESDLEVATIAGKFLLICL
jgi:hypothetical protein